MDTEQMHIRETNHLKLAAAQLDKIIDSGGKASVDEAIRLAEAHTKLAEGWRNTCSDAYYRQLDAEHRAKRAEKAPEVDAVGTEQVVAQEGAQ